MNCIFVCVFNQEKYVEMFFLLLESIFIYGKLDDNTNILVYTSSLFMNKIKNNRLFNNAKMIFEINDEYNNIDKSCKARLDLFNLSSIKKYNKILYLDTDILVKDDINKVFDICKENILYTLEEGRINNKNNFWGNVLFGNEINNYNDKTAFTSGILLFNNCTQIKDLFDKINEDMINRPYNLSCMDQPYIVYNAFKYNLYNNKILKSVVVNRNHNIHSNKIIHHFPGGPGNYGHKLVSMNNFLDKIKNFTINNNINKATMYTNNIYFKSLENKTYTWGKSYIKFLDNLKMDAFGKGDYEFVDKQNIIAKFGGKIHNIKFNDDYTSFSSTRKGDLQIVTGNVINLNIIPTIPKVLFQTNKTPHETYVLNMIMNMLTPEWKYEFYNDADVIQFFINNPLTDLPHIITKYNSIKKGSHKADLFRYYYLYINGGFFMDSDAMLYVNIDTIVKDYNFISVVSSCHPGTIFQGILGASPKNEIIKRALYKAYNTDPSILNINYHYFCKQLYDIIKENNFGYNIKYNIKLYQERRINSHDGDDILDGNTLLFKHYWKNKKIPLNKKQYTDEFTKIYNTNYWVKGSGSGSYIENTIVYNKYIVDFIKKNNIHSITDIGCGDWQSSYLIYKHFDNIDYIGLDCVNSVIEKNKKNHPKYNFYTLDILCNIDLIRDCDLYIIKDVLQHWKLKDIYDFLDKLVTKNFKYIIITNNGNQKYDDLELNAYIGNGRGLNSKFLPLKKYNAELLLDYFGDEKKHMCIIRKDEPL